MNKKYSTRYYLSLVLIDEGKCDCLHILPLAPCAQVPAVVPEGFRPTKCSHKITPSPKQATRYPNPAVNSRRLLHMHRASHRTRNRPGRLQAETGRAGVSHPSNPHAKPRRAKMGLHPAWRPHFPVSIAFSHMSFFTLPFCLSHFCLFSRIFHFIHYLHSTPPETEADYVVSPDARRYFKQSEILLYRQTPEIAATPQIAQQQQIQQQLLQQQQQQQQQQPLPPGSATPGPGQQQTVAATAA